MKDEWDRFADTSRNATFILRRDFMDYHSDRFADHSLIARRGRKILALLAANECVDDSGRHILQSHGGLTYGGWICGERHPDAEEMLQLFRALQEYCLNLGIEGIDYRPIPWIYARRPSQEDIYALFRMGAQLTECNVSATIALRDNPGFNSRQKRYAKRALKDSSVHIDEMADTAEFHQLLTACLQERHGVAPVHTAAELSRLKERFPRQIRVFMLGDSEGWQAGVCIFDCGVTVHAQYICSTLRGRERGLLTLLFSRLIAEVFADREYFDFGTSNESHGLILNAPLYRQKHGLGGTSTVYPRYYLPFK